MQILLWSIAFVASLAVLVKAADYFTGYSETVGKILGIPQFIIGVSIVALGTSLPELITSIIATTNDYSSIVAANVVGSNIANTLLVIGAAAIFSKVIVVEKSLIKLDLPILTAITALLIVLLYDGSFTMWEGLIMLATYVVYIAYNYYEHKQSQLQKIEEKILEKRERVSTKLILLLILSGIGIYIGAQYTIKSIITLSELLNLAPAAIAISAVAIGTSLPELIVSIQAAKKKNFEMVLGNVIGSNILNAAVVMAIPSFISTLNVTSEVITIAIPFLIISTLLITFSGIERKIFSFEGALFGIIYFVFIGQLFNII